MNAKVVLAAVAAGLILITAGSCESSEVDDDCEWELEEVVYNVPRPPAPRPAAPAPKAPAAKVPGAKPPVKMPAVKPPKPTKKPSKGKKWDLDCD